MESHEITIWLNEHRWSALEKALNAQASDIETHLTEYLIDLYEQTVSSEEFARVEALIKEEQNRALADAEASRRFSIAYVAEHGERRAYLTERGENPYQTGLRLRRYLRGEGRPGPLYPDEAVLSQERAERYTAEAAARSPRVVGVYDIDLDKGTLSVLDTSYGWRTFRAKDVSAAAYFAGKSQWASQEKKQQKFDGRLEYADCNPAILPVYIRGAEPLPVDAVCFVSDINEDAGRFLNFYVPVNFDADAVFGVCVCTTENDDWINVYADYDMEKGDMVDALSVHLSRSDGTELCCSYRLTPDECAALLPKMDAYCQEQMGVSLETLRAQYLSEQPTPPSAPTM